MPVVVGFDMAGDVSVLFVSVCVAASKATVSEALGMLFPFTLVAVAAPKTGVTRVGELALTKFPVPVAFEVVSALPPFIAMAGAEIGSVVLTVAPSSVMLEFPMTVPAVNLGTAFAVPAPDVGVAPLTVVGPLNVFVPVQVLSSSTRGIRPDVAIFR